MKYKVEIKGDTVKLNFNSGDFVFRCKLLIKEKYGSVELWDKENKGYKLSIYKHIDDMIFCVMTTMDGDRYNTRASYWHSFGNLFDDSPFSLENKINETIDVIETVCLDQYKLFTEGK
jgi:hypothetical protein